MRISDWSSDVCSSDLKLGVRGSLAIDPAPGTHFDLSVTWWRNKSDTVAGQGIGFTPATNPATGTSNSRFFNTPGLADYIANNFPTKASQADWAPEAARSEIGRASCRERMCQYV